MKKFDPVLKLAVSLLWLCASAAASSEYVIANNNNSVANSATIYKLNSRTGRLAKVSVLHTGGQGLGVEADLSGVEQAVSRDMRCLFVLDTKSSDIAAFSKATGYKRVGSYFDSNLISGVSGDSLALSPSGKFLYASYTYTDRLAVWGVNADCTLGLTAITPGVTVTGPLAVTPNGAHLLSRSGGYAVEFAIDPVTGNLTYIGAGIFETGACARQQACIPYGIAITGDSRVAIFASYAPDVRREHMIPVMLTAAITSKGLADPKVRSLTLEKDLRFNIFPFLSSAAYEGGGTVYLGVTTGGVFYSRHSDSRLHREACTLCCHQLNGRKSAGGQHCGHGQHHGHRRIPQPDWRVPHPEEWFPEIAEHDHHRRTGRGLVLALHFSEHTVVALIEGSQIQIKTGAVCTASI